MPDYLRINVNDDVELEIIFFLGFALYSDVIKQDGRQTA